MVKKKTLLLLRSSKSRDGRWHGSHSTWLLSFCFEFRGILMDLGGAGAEWKLAKTRYPHWRRNTLYGNFLSSLCLSLFLIITSSLSSRFVVGCQPGEAFVKAVASSGTSGLNMPVAVTHPCKTQLFLNFVRFHGWKFEKKNRLNEKSFAIWIKQTFCHR